MRWWPTLCPVDMVGELAGSTGCSVMPGTCSRRNFPAPMIVPPVPDAGHERRRHEPLRRQLAEDFRASRLVVGVAVVPVGELPRQEGARRGVGQLLGARDAPEEPALLAADQHDARPRGCG